MHVARWRTLLLGALAVLPLLAGAAEPTITLRELVDQAWQRSPAGRSQAARQVEQDATRELAASWLAAQPVLGVSRRSDRWHGEGGMSESELSVATSLWTPGQRAARRTLAAEAGRDLQAQTRKARLEIAGEVRTRLWDAAAGQVQLEEKQDHLQHMEQLADEVRRRVGAGDLARVDALLAEQEVQAAQVEVQRARADAQAGAARLRVLTGYAGALPLAPEPLAAATADNPRLQAARSAEQRARAALQLAQASRNAPPTVSLSMRRERDIARAAPERSLGLALQIPLGGAARNRPAEAQAQAQLDAAGAEAELAAAAAESDLEVARAALESTRLGLEAARARAGAMAEHHRLIERAFKLGERGLQELIRSNALAHEAQVALRQQEVAHARAHAQLNQASGALP